MQAHSSIDSLIIITKSRKKCYFVMLPMMTFFTKSARTDLSHNPPEAILICTKKAKKSSVKKKTIMTPTHPPSLIPNRMIQTIQTLLLINQLKKSTKN